MNKEKLEMIRENYPIGTRIKLISMEDIDAIPPDTLGTIDYIDALGTLQISWDNGRSLGLIYGKDNFEIVNKPSKDIKM